MEQAGRRTPLPRQGAGPAHRWEEAAGAAGVGSFDWDLRTGVLVWSEALLALFGLDEHTFGGTIEAFTELVHPEDRARVAAALEEAVDTAGEYEAEYRVQRPDGQTRWLHARGRALCDESGQVVRVVGAAFDRTAVHEGEARVARVLEAMSAAFLAFDTSWRFTYVNAEAERLLGRLRDELLGGVLWDLYPDAVGSVIEQEYRRAVATGQPTRFEAYYPAPPEGWYELRAWPSSEGLSVSFLNITEQRAARRRTDLLARVSTELTETLDVEEAVARLARLVVPELADLCMVSLVGDEQVDWRRRVRDVAWTTADPALQPALDVYAAGRVEAFLEDSPFPKVLQSAEPLVLHDAVAQLAPALRPGPVRDALFVLSPRTAVLLPVRARGRTRGVLTLWWRERDQVRPEDLQTAVDLAARAGLALDNARLYERQRELSEALQRALLTEPPQPDDLQVVVRYLPATEAARVGGDWYDAFLQPDGATTLVIGDVVGHDATAAAAMGQLRGLLRGIAATTGVGPAEVLSRLDAAMEVLEVRTTATAVLARLEQTDEERAQGLTRLRWSSAGHPPPAVVGPDGRVRLLTSDDADLLLGIVPGTPRREHVEVLPRGTTVLLYTDGLLERRGRSLDEGLAELQVELGDLAPLDLDALCDALLTRMLDGGREDDVALTAVRLHPQDRPAPAQAGPRRVPPAAPADP